VIARDDDFITLRYRDYPKYGKFVRHRAAVAKILIMINDTGIVGTHGNASSQSRRPVAFTQTAVPSA
jgi:hypothetical protein